MPLNPSFSEGQVASALAHLGASHLVISLETTLPRLPQPRSNLGLIGALLAAASGPRSLKKVILVNNAPANATVGRSAPSGAEVVKFEDVCADGAAERGPLVPAGQALDPDDVINIQFTSGFVILRCGDAAWIKNYPGRRVSPRLLA